MNVTIRNEYRVEAVLTSDELNEYGITYEEIDYKNIDQFNTIDIITIWNKLKFISMSLDEQISELIFLA